MLESDETFSFKNKPELNAYGKAIPYYCEVTTTSDQLFGVYYKIYDANTRKLIDSNQ